jgi:DNA phosphorothioation-dependent restriction protein DptG
MLNNSSQQNKIIFRIIIESALKLPDNKAYSDKVHKFVTSTYTDWTDPSNPGKISLQVATFFTDIFRAIPAVQMNRLNARLNVSLNMLICFYLVQNQCSMCSLHLAG